MQADALSHLADVSVFSGQYPGVELLPPADLGVSVTYTELPWPRGPLPSFVKLLFAARAYAYELNRRLAEGPRPDVIHAHYAYPDGYIATACAHAVGIPVVVTLHGSDVNVQLTRRVVGNVLLRRLEKAESVICVSEHMKEVLSDRRHGLNDRISAIPNGYDASCLCVDDAEPSGGFLFVGQLVPVKQVDILLKAYAAAIDRVRSDVTIIGDGPEADSLRSVAVDLGISERVHFRGTLPHADTMEAIGNARCLVLPSASEGLPTVVVEALACGTPVIASAVGGVPNILASNLSGSLVPAGDVVALTDAMVQWDSMRVSRASVRSSAEVLSWDDVARRILDVYQEVVG